MVLAPVVSNREEDSMNNEPSLSGKSIIGLIYPPPDIRTIVDKTATFVARNGIDFENKIREKEASNPRFSFLNATDPYHAYYKHKVKDCQEGKIESVAAPKPIVPEAVKEAIKKAEFVPTKPPPAYEFSADPATINAFDLDLIRTTAIFVARNGRQFLTQVMTREARNYQFDFLKPAHSNFSYFTKLVEQYTKVIIPPSNILDTLSTDKQSTKKLMEDIKYRVAWDKHQKTLKDKEEKEAEKERLAYAAIDWHDFVVVQTVDFQPGDNANLPGLCTPQDVGARILLEQRQEMNKTAGEAVEMDMEESDSEDESELVKSEVMQPEVIRPTPDFTAPLPPTKQKDIIVKDYDPKTMHKQKRAAEKYLISPLTGERVPSDKLEEHVRYNTVDSQYIEGRDRFASDRANEEPVLAPGADISRNLGNFAERRSDIFGVGAAGAEQTVIGRKLGEEEPTPMNTKHIWDGSEETREMHTQRVQNQVTLDQQIHEIHRQHGYLPDAGKERIGAQPIPKPPPPTAAAIPIPQRAPVPRPPPSQPLQHIPPPVMDGPPAKRQRTEEDLESESQWLEKVSGVVDLRVQLPIAHDLGLDGSIIAVQIDIKSSVSEIKQMIQEATGMATAKQKLNFDGFFLKDQSSLAFYNLNNHSLITVQVKERGGKNK